MTDQEKIKFLITKMLGLASAIHMFLDTHEISPDFFDMAAQIDWVAHFEKAIEEYDKMPEPK